MEERTCTEPDCQRGGKLVRGMCGKHYAWWLTQTPKDQRPIAPRFVDDFWDHVNRSHEFGCWTWTDKAVPKGYGVWRRTYAHRESWSRANGQIPEGIWVLHHCDNPPCVNPRHLYLGTVVENVADMIARGRKYVPPQRERCSNGHLLEGDNVRLHGKRQVRTCRICDNAKSAATQDKIRRAKGIPPADRLSGAEKATIIELRSNGLSQKAIAAATGRGIATVQKVLYAHRDAA